MPKTQPPIGVESILVPVPPMNTEIQKEVTETSEEEEARMTFTGHLSELRTRLVRSIIAVFAGFILCYIFSNELIELLSRPLAPLEAMNSAAPANGETVDMGISWTVLNPIEPVLVKLKLAAYGGLLLALPFVLFQFGAFIFPGLTDKEKRVVNILLGGCSVLAMAGVSIAYWVVFPQVLPYLADFAPDFVRIQLRLNETLSLIMKGLAGFAIAFQFPLVVLVLVYMGLLTPETLKQHRRVAIVCMFVGGALLTPPDPFSMLMMAAPLVVLYEISIWVSYLVVRRKKVTEE